jgi:hypothetical protein
MAEVFYSMGSHCEGEPAVAMNYFKKALTHHPSHGKANAGAAKAALAMEDFAEAERLLNGMIAKKISLNEAQLLMTDIICRTGTMEAAVAHLKGIIQRNEHNYEALLKLIRLIRHQGYSMDFLVFLEGPSQTDSAGHHFCTGKYFRYSNKFNGIDISWTTIGL